VTQHHPGEPGDHASDATVPSDGAASGTSTAPAAPRRALPGRLVWVVWAAVALAVLVCDQATKGLAVAELTDRIIDLGFMDLRLIRNPNAAFDIPGFPGMFLLVAIVVLTMIVRTLPGTDRLSLAAGYGLLTGGALGNAIDRIARDPGFPTGHVVDFFDLRWFPVFNIADSAIVCGAILLGLLLLRAEREERQAATAPRRPSVRPDTSTPRR
jgi:signal peptidase II